MLGLLPGTANGLNKVRLRDLFSAREIARGDLGVDLDARIGGQEVLCEVAQSRWLELVSNGGLQYVPGMS